MAMKYYVTDSQYKALHVKYVEETLHDTIKALGGITDYKEEDERAVLRITLPDGYAKHFCRSIEEAVTNAIIIGYKWELFQREVKVEGLEEAEYQYFLNVLIAADYVFDIGYVLKRTGTSPYSIDGIYNFSIAQMIKKWRKIAEDVPYLYDKNQLRSFVEFACQGHSNEKYYVSKDGVFNAAHVRMRKSMLTGGYDLLKELLIACPGSIELDCPLEEEQEKMIKFYFGKKILFGKNYIAQKND